MTSASSGLVRTIARVSGMTELLGGFWITGHGAQCQREAGSRGEDESTDHCQAETMGGAYQAEPHHIGCPGEVVP